MNIFLISSPIREKAIRKKKKNKLDSLNLLYTPPQVKISKSKKKNKHEQ